MLLLWICYEDVSILKCYSKQHQFVTYLKNILQPLLSWKNSSLYIRCSFKFFDALVTFFQNHIINIGTLIFQSWYSWLDICLLIEKMPHVKHLQLILKYELFTLPYWSHKFWRKICCFATRWSKGYSRFIRECSSFPKTNKNLQKKIIYLQTSQNEQIL